MVNKGKFISRETETFSNGDMAVTDTFMLKDGTLVVHTYNVSADKKEHDHTAVDENGKYRGGHSSEPRPWYNLNRTMTIASLALLDLNNLKKLMLLTKNEAIFNLAKSILEERTNKQGKVKSLSLFNKNRH